MESKDEAERPEWVQYASYLFRPNPSPIELALNGLFVSGVVMVAVAEAPIRAGIVAIAVSLYLLLRYEVWHSHISA